MKIKNSRSQLWRHKDLEHHHHDQCCPAPRVQSDEIYFYLCSLASTITLSVGWITNSTERWWIFPGLLPDHLGAELTTNNKHYHRYIHNIQHCSHQGWNHSSFVEITIRKQQEISKFRLQKIELYWYWYCRSSHLRVSALDLVTIAHVPVPAHQLTSTINITSYYRLLLTLYLKALIKCFTICQSHRHK